MIIMVLSQYGISCHTYCIHDNDERIYHLDVVYHQDFTGKDIVYRYALTHRYMISQRRSSKRKPSLVVGNPLIYGTNGNLFYPVQNIVLMKTERKRIRYQRTEPVMNPTT